MLKKNTNTSNFGNNLLLSKASCIIKFITWYTPNVKKLLALLIGNSKQPCKYSTATLLLLVLSRVILKTLSYCSNSSNSWQIN